MSKISRRNWREYCEESELTVDERSELRKMCDVLNKGGRPFAYVTQRTALEWTTAAGPFHTYEEFAIHIDASRRLDRAELAAWREWQEREDGDE